MDITVKEYREAVAKLSDEDFTKDGAPKVDALNDALDALGYCSVTASERDALELAEAADDEAEAEDQAKPEAKSEDGSRLIRLDRSGANPLVLRVNGKVCAAIRVGETVRVSEAVFEMLSERDDIEFTEVAEERDNA